MSEFKYHDEEEIKIHRRLIDLKKQLPIFMSDYFRGIETTTTEKTKLAYAYDARCFFSYLLEHNPALKNVSIRNFPLSVLEQLQPSDIDEYMEYLKYSEDDNIEIRNKETGLYRKISSLRSMYSYFYRKEAIKYNPAEIVKIPKLRSKEIIRLEPDEVARLLDYVESSQGSSKRQASYRQNTKVRDLAILTLMLGTGIRVSECVGLDLDHVDFKNDAIKIMRKGEKEATVYFGDEVEVALKDYIEERKKIVTLPGHENALFLSIRRKRIAVRTIETLVKGYAKVVTPLKHITPHKLRSTYGTNLYAQTNDIYLVADVLGHEDVNTTKKHYAAQSDSARRRAAKEVILREQMEK